MRYSDDAMETLDGWEQVFDAAVPAALSYGVASPTINFWLYTSLNKAAVFDGRVHTDITRVIGGDYTASETRQWNGTILSGIAIVNNGVDVPQYWATASIATKLANLPNWDPNVRAKVIRAFGPFLVAIDLIISGNGSIRIV